MKIPWWGWITPGVLIGVMLVALLYTWVMWGPLQDKRPFGQKTPTRKQALSFFAAMFACYLALGSPIGTVAMMSSFAAHMLQHIIAGIAVPPFLIRGIPEWGWRALLRPRWVNRAFRWFVRPAPAILIFNAVFAVMVLPSVILAMVESMPAMVEWHTLLMLVGIFMWWPLMSPLEEIPALHPGVQLLYLFLDGLPMILPLALVTLDTQSLYSASYAHRPELWGLSLVADQQLGGALCLTVVHFVFGGMVIPRFQEWAKRERRDDLPPKLTVISSPQLPGKPIPAKKSGWQRPGTTR